MVKMVADEHKSDEELVNLTLVNQDNFLFLMKRYEGRLLKYILRLSNISKEEAEDILQDVFIKVFKNLNDFDADLKFSSWIYRVTHNEVISNFRKLQSRAHGNTIELNEEIINYLIFDLDLTKEIDRSLLRDKIKIILNRIDIKYREVLILKFFEEKDYKEISDIIKKPMGTVATLISRAKDKFREEITKNNIKL